MKKMFFYVIALAMTLVSCEKMEMEGVESESNSLTKDVQFVMKGLTVEYATRATVQSEGMTDLWVYEGEKLLKHQVSTDADFGLPTVTLTYGAHDLTFVASKSEGQAFDTYWTCTKVSETYGTAMNVTVSKGSSTSRQVDLKRINSKIQWTIEDVVPATAKMVEISIDNYYGLNSGLNGLNFDTYTRLADISGKRGATNVVINSTVLTHVYGEENDCEAHITIKDEGGNILSDFTNQIQLKANRITNIHGAFFGDGGQQTVNLLSNWDTQADVDL